METETRETIISQIKELEEKVEQLNVELDAVRDKLGKAPLSDNTSPDKEESSPDEPTNAEQEPNEVDGEGERDKDELQKLEEELTQEILIAQMKIIALQKELNDIEAVNAMDNFEEE